MMTLLSNFFFRIQAEAHEHEHHERIKQAALHRPEDHFGQAEAHIAGHYQYAPASAAANCGARRAAAQLAQEEQQRRRQGRRPSAKPTTPPVANSCNPSLCRCGSDNTTGSSLPSWAYSARRARQACEIHAQQRMLGDQHGRALPQLEPGADPGQHVAALEPGADVAHAFVEARLHAAGRHEPGPASTTAADRQQGAHAAAAEHARMAQEQQRRQRQRQPAAAAAGQQRGRQAGQRTDGRPALAWRGSLAHVDRGRHRQQRQQQGQVAEGDRIDQAARAVDAQRRTAARRRRARPPARRRSRPTTACGAAAARQHRRQRADREEHARRLFHRVHIRSAHERAAQHEQEVQQKG